MVNRNFRYVFNTEIVGYRSQGVMMIAQVNVCFGRG
jgi:hypothetical protein